MGVLSFAGKATAFFVVIIAVLVGLLLSGALTQLGVFTYLDTFEGSRGGAVFKGMIPAAHEGKPWGFTEADIPDLTGDTVFVTGGNVGLGYWTAHHLAAHGATVVIGCRSQGKCDKAAESLQAATGKAVETALLDLNSFASIRSCASTLTQKHPQLDSLVLNAGVMMPSFGLTEDGLETQIGVNHFGHSLLTKLLLPTLEAAAAAKGVATVVPVSSAAHYDSYPEGILPSVERMNDEATYDRAKAYGQSKLANVLFAQELAERVAASNILVNSVHPGVVETELGRHLVDAINKVSSGLGDWLFSKVNAAVWTPRDAALTQLYAAVGPALKKGKVTGKYFHPIARENVPDHHARDAALQQRLWAMTEEFIAAH